MTADADEVPRAALPVTRRAAADTARPPLPDEARFRDFYDRTAGPLRGYLLRLGGGDQGLADDILQETYYRHLMAGPVTDDPAHARAFLYRVATNLMYDHFRRARREARGLLFWRPAAALRGGGGTDDD